MNRKYEKIASTLGHDLGFGTSHKLNVYKISGIARRLAKILWPNETIRSKNLRREFTSDVLWHSGINDE